MKSDWIKKNCNGCGECCMRNTAMELIEGEEWEKIVTFINENKNGELYVMDFNPKIMRYLKRCFKPKLEDLSVKSSSELFRILKDDKNPCPFFKFDREEAKYYCTIQAIKPETCLNWYCDPLNFASSEFNVCVLNFGQKIEYPICKECQECGLDEDNPRKKGEPPECEMGKGCFFLERRVRYFLRYAKNYPNNNDILPFAKKLIDILKKQDKIFKNLLKTNVDITKEEINLNLNKYADMITDIKTVTEII